MLWSEIFLSCLLWSWTKRRDGQPAGGEVALQRAWSVSMASVVERGPGLHFLARRGPASPLYYRGLLTPSDKHLHLCLQQPGRCPGRQLIEAAKETVKDQLLGDWHSQAAARVGEISRVLCVCCMLHLPSPHLILTTGQGKGIKSSILRSGRSDFLLQGLSDFF